MIAPVIDAAPSTSGMCTILNAEYVLRAIRGGLTWSAPQSTSAPTVAAGHPVSVQPAPVGAVLTAEASAWYTAVNVQRYRQLLACSLLSDWAQQYPIPSADDAAKSALTELEDLLPTCLGRDAARWDILGGCLTVQCVVNAFLSGLFSQCLIVRVYHAGVPL